MRDAFGTVAYGFFPMRAMDPQLAARLIHSADERSASTTSSSASLAASRRRRGRRAGS